MIAHRFEAVSALVLLGGSVASASPAALGPEDRALLGTYARDTWRSIGAMAAAGKLPADSLQFVAGGTVASGPTSPTNIAAYFWSIVAAEDLQLVSSADASRRLGVMLDRVARLERAHGFFFNWYESDTGVRPRTWPNGETVRPFLSSVDNAWLAAAMMLVGNVHPEWRDATQALLGPMDFGFFYDPYDPSAPTAHPGLLRGGYWTDDGTVTGFHYGTLNTEPRIASYIGIARGELPAEHYYRMTRARGRRGPIQDYHGVAVAEGGNSYRGIDLVPSWDGTMFEALMVPLFVPEAEWAPESWGINHPRYVQAQREYGLHDARLGYWGTSASSVPGGGYRAFGIPALGSGPKRKRDDRPGVIAPYATFLALPFAPEEAMANLRALAAGYPLYGPFGFADAVDPTSGTVSDRVLILDQGMILAAIAQVLGTDVLRRGFSAGIVEAAIRPLIAPERFLPGNEGQRRLSSASGRRPHELGEPNREPKARFAVSPSRDVPESGNKRSANPRPSIRYQDLQSGQVPSIRSGICGSGM